MYCFSMAVRRVSEILVHTPFHKTFELTRLICSFFGFSWGPCAWILVAEVWPLSARPYGIALGASSNWMNNFIVGQVRCEVIRLMRLS